MARKRGRKYIPVAQRRAIANARAEKANSNLTLKKLTELQPPQDRNDPALLPAVKAKPSYPGYTPPPPWPQTLNDMAQRCGPYADLAIAEAKAVAVHSWAYGTFTKKGNAKANPRAVLWEVLTRARYQMHRDHGVSRPNTDGTIPAALDGFSPDCQSEALLVLEETYAEWEAAGSPGLDQPALYVVWRWLMGHIWSGTLPPFEGCPEAP